MAGNINTSLTSKLQITLFTTPKVTVTPARGSVSVTNDQAKALLLGKDYAGINTASKPNGEIRGTVTSSTH